MVRKVEYDFITWTSFPSSLKLFSDEYRPPPPAPMAGLNITDIIVTPGKNIRVVAKAKQQNVLEPRSRITLYVSKDGRPPWTDLVRDVRLQLPSGTFDWRDYSFTVTIPAGLPYMRVVANGGPGTPEAPGITWFDDLKIYQDDKLIYDNYFSATPRPLKVVPVFNVTERVVRVYQRIRPGIIKPK